MHNFLNFHTHAKTHTIKFYVDFGSTMFFLNRLKQFNYEAFSAWVAPQSSPLLTHAHAHTHTNAIYYNNERGARCEVAG